MRRSRLPGPRRRWRAVCLSLALLPGAGAAARAADRTPEQQVESRLMCYCGCSDLTVRTCTCGTADGMRQEIRERLGRGESADAVVAAFVAERGEQIRSAPTKRGFDLLAWSAPYVAILAAGGLLVVLIRRWGRPVRLPAHDAADGPPAPQALSPQERDLMRRVEREIRDGR